eukprot:CAMPEP_0168452122 /NCGR_PEP_ID=MMETSP0228-20121227/48985_1 /TAXON_ID=133427 /ORGANISM="Protoceratium reticulatum, Strain CCCM 535 (=CCMP 1889)" /LENGTH=453 /DNA_ID=CAMNT_0008466753 /DNA_START=10 /DNA_END=1369 /DNA_ORIENTATION=-
MSMHTVNEWHQHAGNNMTQAGQSHRRAHRQNEASRRAHDETVHENLGRYGALQGSLEQKVADSNRLVDNLQRRAESLQNSIAKTNQSLAQLEQAHQAKEPQIQLCLWRMAQREKRPLREQVRDNAEVTLENEKSTLVETQRLLADQIKRTKACVKDLEDKLEEVRHDIDHKVQALGIDETCLRTANRSYQSMLETSRPSSVPPGGLPSHKGASARLTLQETSRNEMTRHQDAARLAHSGGSKEERAKALRDENQQLIGRCQKAADEAQAKTERFLQDRVNENQQMRRRLEADIRETKGKIDQTKDTISETRNQIKSLEEPMDMTATCASYRRQRATREHIHDPVSTKIQEHQMTVLHRHQDLVGHHASEKMNLQDLNERMERLREDLKDKTGALHLDQNCLTHQAAHHNHTLPFTYSTKVAGARRSRPDNNLSFAGSAALRHDLGTMPMSAAE